MRNNIVELAQAMSLTETMSPPEIIKGQESGELPLTCVVGSVWRQ